MFVRSESVEIERMKEDGKLSRRREGKKQKKIFEQSR